MSARARSGFGADPKIVAIHQCSTDTCGSPNNHAELLADDHGIRVGRKRVARLMRAAGLRGPALRRYAVTTQTDSAARPPVDLLYPRRLPGIEVHPTPDFEWAEQELKRKHVTRRQLWREYQARSPMD